MKNKAFFDRNCTDVIKGIALILMFVHHFFTFPEWFVGGISYDAISGFARIFREPTMICVPVFAFLTGYFYFFAKHKTFKYSLKKSTDLYISYLVIFALLYAASIIFGSAKFSCLQFAAELFALDYSTMCFCWYVLFYVMAIFILPIYSRLSEKSDIGLFLVSLVLSVLCKNIGSVFGYLSWFCCVSCGYLFAKRDVFSEFSRLFGKKSGFLNAVCALLLIFTAMATRFLSTDLDFAVAPMFVYGIAVLYNMIKAKKLFLPLKVIGKYSLSMWFLHCIFFSRNCKGFAQPLLYLPKSPVLITIFGLLLCLLAAAILDNPIKFLQRLKNSLFEKDKK